MTVRIRRFVPEDTEAVLALRGRSFEGLDLERERVRWAWEYEANPFARDDVPRSWVAEDHGQLIGNYGMLPIPVAIDGERALAVFAMDVCVDPACRKLGLGLRLTRRFLETRGVDLFLSTSATAETSQLLAYCGTAVMKVESEPSLWIHTGGGTGSVRLPVVEVASFGARCDALFARVAGEQRLLTFRDQRYLNWRYRDYPFGEPDHLQAFALPDAEGGYRGLAVLQYDPALDRAYLLELLTPSSDEAAAAALIAEALNRRQAAGWGDLYALHRAPAVQRALAAAAFTRVAAHEVRLLIDGPAGTPGLDDWYVTAGDGDFLFNVGR